MLKFLHKPNIEIVIAILLFSVAMLMGKMMDFIIYMLYFIIFLEIVRALMSYLREERVMIRFLVDAFIILSLREFIVNVVKINKEEISSYYELLNEPTMINLIVLSLVILFLFFVRFLAIKTSHSKKEPPKES
jgi:uncharacterized membrane protein (DUF373 family)